VRNHGGFIHVSSGKGRGTTFTISLPASEKPVVEEKKPSEEIVKEADGTILLVDDEKMILDVGALLLNQLGYTVITADNGKDAVEQLLRHRGEIDLVLLDMIMPGMSGGDTFDLLKEIDPNVKVILASGYSLEGQAQEIMERGCNGFIQKPFTVKELFRKIQDQLSG
jgi:CheY-like chemotaxis protein